jgi:hypothetical protein
MASSHPPILASERVLRERREKQGQIEHENQKTAQHSGRPFPETSHQTNSGYAFEQILQQPADAQYPSLGKLLANLTDDVKLTGVSYYHLVKSCCDISGRKILSV